MVSVGRQYLLFFNVGLSLILLYRNITKTEQLEKAAVLQDARIFHDSILVREHPRKCCRILAQIIVRNIYYISLYYIHARLPTQLSYLPFFHLKYLQNDAKSISSKLTRTEATELFFASTKLFVDAHDISLRRMVYLFIKEIQPLCDPSDVIIVTSCLTKDMTCDVGLFRSNAIRVLIHIIDSAMLGSIERYIKQAIVDNDYYVSNAALVSASHLFSQSKENENIVRRWVGEVQEMMIKQSTNAKRSDRNSNDMVQANAMRLLCQMKSNDRLGMAKLLQKFGLHAGSGIKSPFAIVILIRLTGKLLTDELISNGHSSSGDVRDVSSLSKLCFEFLESSLSHSNDMISYEAARTICLLPNIGTHNMSRSMECLKSMLLSDKPASRYAATSTLSKVAQPRAVALCNEGLETCAGDDNKEIATLAVSTLLKTGSEAIIDKILGKLSPLIDVVQDEQKFAILKSLEELCLRYPAKHSAIVGFLANLLREEGGFDFKRSIVQSIVSLMKKMPEMTERSLLILAEFIEDCEYTMLSTHTIHTIADLAPLTTVPSQYIPFIYNRLILENSTIRAAAIAALSKFAARCPSQRTSISTLLKNSLNDEDDETRDRATVAVSVLKKAMELNPYVAPGIEEEYNEAISDEPSEGDLAALVYLEPLPMRSFKSLECSITAYMSTPGLMDGTEELTFSTLSDIEDSLHEEKDLHNENRTLANGFDGLSVSKVNDPAAVIYAIPELTQFGRVFHSSTAISLTEDESEYFVKCIKHILDGHIILQLTIHNTIEDILMQNVTVELESDSDGYKIIGDISAERIKYGENVSAFSVIQVESVEAAEFTASLNFTVVQVDTDSGEPLGESYAEEYPLENIIISPSDFMAKIPVSDFRQAWNGTEDSYEALGTFTLQPKTIADAVYSVIELLGMQPCDGTGQPPRDDTKPHMLHLSGKFVGGHEVLARAQLLVKKSEGTLLKVAIRSDDRRISETVMSCIY